MQLMQYQCGSPEKHRKVTMILRIRGICPIKISLSDICTFNCGHEPLRTKFMYMWYVWLEKQNYATSTKQSYTSRMYHCLKGEQMIPEDDSRIPGKAPGADIASAKCYNRFLTWYGTTEPDYEFIEKKSSNGRAHNS
jgi:hypothetical protein